MKQRALWFLLLAGCTANVDLTVGRAYPCDPAIAEGQCAGGWRCSPEKVCFDPSAEGRARACTSDEHCNTGWRCGADGVCGNSTETWTLEFQGQPGNATAGVPLSPGVRVVVKDSRGAIATTPPFDVSLALSVNPTAATLAGGAATRTVNGVATFDTLTIDRAGTGFVLAASAPGATGATSTPFNVTTRTFSKIAFVVQPLSTSAGATLASVQVALQDSLGNTVVGQDQPVTLSLTGGPSGATLLGTTTVDTSAGLATFTTLFVEKAGTAYALLARCPGATDVTSTPFDVAAASPARLRFVAQPGDAVAGAVLSPSPSVALDDAFGNPTPSTAQVTITVTGGATLGGTGTRAASAGVATFDDLHLDQVGSGYTLVASSTGLTSATSGPFAISAAAAASLTFTSSPTSVTQGALLSPVQVSVADAFGNPVTSGTPSVSLSLLGGAAGASLAGTTTSVAAAGQATFSDLSVDRHGTGFTLRATATGLTAATSAAFTVVRLAINASGGRVEIKADAGLSWSLSGTPSLVELTTPDAGPLDVTGQLRRTVVPFPSAPSQVAPLATYKVRAATARLTGELSEPGYATSFGGAASDTLTGLAVDLNGGFIAAGTFSGTTTFGPDGGTQASVTSAGGTDAVVSRFDETGELLWLVRAGGTGADAVSGIARLRDDSVAVVGTYSGSATFGSGDPNQTTLTTAGSGSEFFVARYFASGQLAWVRRASSNNLTASSEANGVAALPDGALVVTGSFARQTVFGLGELNATTLCAEANCSSGVTDMFIARYELDGSLAWVRRAGGASSDRGWSVAVAHNGEACVGGQHNSAATFGPGEANQTVLPSASSLEGFVACFTPAGSLKWARNIAATSTATIASTEVVTIAPDGTVFAGGRFSGTTTLGAGEPNATSLTSAGSEDGWIARFAASDGALAWARGVGGAQPDSVTALAALDDGSLAAAGRFQVSAQIGGRTLTASGTINVYLARLSASGAVLELDRSGSGLGDAESVTALVAQPDGTVWVGGSFLRTATFGVGDQSAVALTSAGAFDGYLFQWSPTTWRLASFEPTGLTWAFAGGGIGSESAKAVAALPDGRVVAVGNYTGTSVTFGSTTLTPGTSTDGFVVSLSPAGTVEWASRISGSSVDQINGLTGHLDGSVTLVGSFSGALTLGATTLTSAGDSDLFLVRYDKAGAVVWARRAGGTLLDEALGISATPGGGFVVTGDFAGSAIFGPGEGLATTLTSAGSSDVFVAQYASDGTLRWAKRAGGTTDDLGQAVSALPSGGCVVTGFILGTAVFGLGEANQTSLVTPSSNDLFVARYGPTGLLQWAKRAGGNGITLGAAVSALPDGSSWVVGNLSGSGIVFGPGDPTQVTFNNSGVVAARYGADGKLTAAKLYTSGGLPQGSSVVTFDDGSAIFGGWFPGGLTNEFGTQTYLTAVGADDGFALRLGSSGFPSGWRAQVGASGSDFVNGVCSLSDGSAVLGGGFTSAVTLNATSVNAQALSGTAQTVFVAKYSAPAP